MGNHKVLQTSARSIRYSMYDFIEAVKRHSIVWNRDHQHFHHREKREAAWPSIARQLMMKQFDDATKEEKSKIAETLAKRWKNTRDSYFRSQRERDLDDERHRSYIYEKELTFLSRDNNDDDHLQVSDETQEAIDKRSKDKESVKKLRTSKRTSNAAALATKVSAKKRRLSITSNFSLNSEIEEVFQEIEEQMQDNTNDGEKCANESSQTIKDEKRQETKNRNQLKDSMMKSKEVVVIPAKSYNTSTDETITPNHPIREDNTVNSNSNSNVVASTTTTTASPNNEPDPDQAFFDSIKPVVRNMSVDQKLDFQIEILKLLKNFRSK